MTRRVSLPGAAELFRSTSAVSPSRPEPAPVSLSDQPVGTGRRKHDAKITVYLSDEELLALEHARLALRAAHGLAVDRGRVVREAIAAVLADLADNGADSELVRRLRGGPGR
ncbi:hypothetical protein GCM10010174_16310 [Kutzneria viridogrisea]|uniref:Cobyrinic acid a,c-diamide synthase n=2 Tax=Kutzneria TaxID=43356 RepID=W5WGB2_9PSEU|nr:hypothetical protein [Kutzneria albida]AHH99790.1 hypothetical protein KALB_6431 [Kutzneria albida DSM 43870]MBA8924967.1 hypothetical protein [Kutzneria viridogrisea]